MRVIKLIIAYDGTDFCGWQRQRETRTVQGVLEAALEKLHKKPITLYGAGRTDAGVHAAGQCAHFQTDIDGIEAGRFAPALNSLLPADVRVRLAAEAGADFHARFSAKFRTYRYFIIPAPRNFPHETRYALQTRTRPGIALLNGYTRCMRGEFDCALFASPSDPIFERGSGSTFRFIDHASFFAEGSRVVFEITANAFFRRMVRSMVGTLLLAAEDNLSVRDFETLLRSRDHARAGPTAPARGLFLWNIAY